MNVKKNLVGRPRKINALRRTGKRIDLLLSQDDYQKLLLLLQNSKLSKSDMVRKLIREDYSKTKEL